MEGTVVNKLKTHFDDTFFEEEKRCDYLVTSRSKKIWAIQIDLFNELFRVCRSHDIKVCAFSVERIISTTLYMVGHFSGL